MGGEGRRGVICPAQASHVRELSGREGVDMWGTTRKRRGHNTVVVQEGGGESQ